MDNQPLSTEIPFVRVNEQGDTLATYRGCDAKIWHRYICMDDYIIRTYWPDGDVSQSSHSGVEAALEHFVIIVDSWRTLEEMRF